MKISLDLIDLPELDLRASIDEEALDELAASMRDHGQLQPIGVTEKPDGRYEVVFGARRTRAARLLEWKELEGNVRDAMESDRNAAAKLIENVQRLEMTPMEEAYGIAAMIGDENIDIRKLQRQTGKGRAWIINRLDLIAMPEDLQQAVQDGSLTIGVAKEFSSIENADVRKQYVDAAKENGCTATQARIWAGQAQFAEQGIMSMEQFEKHGLPGSPEPQIVDQHYPCFVCTTSTNWRRVNVLPVCGACQDAITESRVVTIAEPTTPPLDSEQKVN